VAFLTSETGPIKDSILEFFVFSETIIAYARVHL
jgi:hypothetical protein